MKTAGYAAVNESTFEPYHFEVREPKEKDVHIEIHYCGICHSDVHNVRNDFKSALYPMVPGHEIAGVVKSVGSGVTKYKVGDRVGVGCLVDSCRTCEPCKTHQEPQCSQRVFTYNKQLPDGSISRGGYARDIVVDEDFVIAMPDAMPLDAGAPLLCAGITTYSAIKFYGMDTKGKTVGIVGLGGLGHVAVQIARAFGNDVTVISKSEAKREDAQKLGATSFVNVSNADELAKAKCSLDYILDTTCYAKHMKQNLDMLKPDGTVVMVGLSNESYQVAPVDLIFNRKSIGGSLIGGIKETQEMIDFCAAHKIVPWIETIPMEKIEDAYKRIETSDIKYRFVIDVQKTAPVTSNA